VVEVEEDVNGLGGVVAGHVESTDDVHLRRAVAEHRAHHGHLLLPLLPHLPRETAAAALLAPGPRNFPQTPASRRRL